MPADPKLVESVFHRAAALPPADRESFLAGVCGGDADLRQRVERLLAAHAELGQFLDIPAADPGDATRTADPGTGSATADYPPGGEAGLVIAGRYTLLERIGEGGMGEVWVARQTDPVQRKVAVKLIKAGMDSKAVVARFEAERQALALMDHPNIAKVLDGGLTDRGRPFFVLELVNGLPLTRFCDEAKLTPKERLELFVPVCQAVQHAHQKGVVHRDLKPSNVLVTLYDGRPVPKVIDFGVAKATGGRLTEHTVSTQFGAVLGTLEYMAPEQAGFSAVDVDTRADVYSLGVILYELLTGLRPFDGERLRKAAFDEVLRIIREEEPPRPSTKLSTAEALPSLAAVRRTEPRRLAALMRGELDWLVMKCLEKDRGRRYETANALARDVQRFLADEPVEARPPSAGYRMRKFLRRNKAGVLVVAAFMLLIQCGAVGIYLAYRRAVAAEVDAREQFRLATAAADAERTARAAEADQRKRADEQRAVAEANARRAQAAAEQSELAVETLFALATRVQVPLRSQPGNQKLRQDALTDALAGLQRVVGKASEDPQSQRVRRAAYQHMGDIARDLGRTEEALANYRESQKITELMAAAQPGEQLTKWNLAIVYDKLGETNHQFLGDGVVARDYYVKCLGLRRELHAGLLTSPDLKPDLAKSNLARTHAKLGDLALSMGDPAGAWDQYRTFLTVQLGRTFATPREALAAANASHGARPISPGLANRLGELSFHLGDQESARGLSERAVRRSREAMARSKGSALSKLILTGVLGSAGDQALYLGDAAGAKKLYTEAHAMVVERVAKDPTAIDLRRALSLSHYRLGAANRVLGVTETADEHFRECLTIREALAKEDPANVFTQIDLALALARAGRHADAAERAAKFRQRAPKDPALLFYAGCTLALCSAAAGTDQGLKDRYLGEALTALSQAVGFGYRDVTALELDPDLDPVRRSPGFAAVLAAAAGARTLPQREVAPSTKTERDKHPPEPAPPPRPAR